MSSSFQTPKEFLSGVINVPVYEAPKELVVNKVLKTIFIFFVYITIKEVKAFRLCETRTSHVWWNEDLLVSSSVGAFFFVVINVPLHGVINVLIYEAPKELTIIFLTLPGLMI